MWTPRRAGTGRSPSGARSSSTRSSCSGPSRSDAAEASCSAAQRCSTTAVCAAAPTRLVAAGPNIATRPAVRSPNRWISSTPRTPHGGEHRVAPVAVGACQPCRGEAAAEVDPRRCRLGAVPDQQGELPGRFQHDLGFRVGRAEGDRGTRWVRTCPVDGDPGYGSAARRGQPAAHPGSGCYPKRQLDRHRHHHRAPAPPILAVCRGRDLRLRPRNAPEPGRLQATGRALVEVRACRRRISG